MGHDLKTNLLYVAHVGDSRAALQHYKPKKEPTVDELTVDHKPNLPEEKKRIENSNPPGRVVFDGYYNYRVFAKEGMYPGLNMSRALGDIVAHKEAGLTAMPDVKRIDIGKEKEGTDKLLLYVCTDGVWEFVNCKDVHGIVGKSLEESPSAWGDKGPSFLLAKESYQRWMQDSDNEVSDDITAIIVQL